MKKILLLLIFVFSISLAKAQTQNNRPLNFTFTKPFTVVWNIQGEARHNGFFYTDFKYKGLQVVSVHEPNTPYDMIYYIDRSGTTQYKSMAQTGLLNQSFNNRHRYDSFNPYGSGDFGQAVVSGLLNTLFRNNARGISFR